MKNKIALRLALYFTVVLLSFSIVVGTLFFFLFTDYTKREARADLEKRTTTIAQTLSSFTTDTTSIKAQHKDETSSSTSEQELNEPVKSEHIGKGDGAGMGKGKNKQTNKVTSVDNRVSDESATQDKSAVQEEQSSSVQGLMQHGSGYGAYMRFLDDIAMTDVWIVDKNLEQIQRGHGQESITYQELPQKAGDVINEVYTGKTSFSEGFSEIIHSPTITVGAPIYDKSDEIVGAVLLHSPIEGISIAVKNGITVVFLSMLVALLLCGIMAVFFSLSFTKPLSKMKQTASKLSSGDYTAKTHVAQSDEIGELAKTIDLLSEKLSLAEHEREKLDHLRNNFIANISHELRTPITVIRGSLEALCDGVVDDAVQIKEYHEQMLADSINLQRLVNDLLELSRLQNLDFVIEMQDINLYEVVSDAVRSMRRIADEKQIEIKFKSQKNDYSITADYGRIRQMLTIILDNAIKFSDNGKEINLSLSGETNATLTISDNGCGISCEDLPYVFDRFHKQKSEQNKAGTGLGLAIAKQISERHRIKMTVTSEVSKGTTFKMGF